MKIAQQQYVEKELNVERAFREHYEGLYRYAFTYTRQNDVARDIVQQVFVSLLERKDKIELTVSLQSYLFKAVHYQCLNYKSRKKNFVSLEELPDSSAAERSSSRVEISEVQKKIKQAIQLLPEQCRIVFLKNREEHKTYLQISGEMEIATKTVEAQMTKALKILRRELGDLLYLLLLLATTESLIFN